MTVTTAPVVDPPAPDLEVDLPTVAADALVLKLEREAALGWPAPWHPQDLAAATFDPIPQALTRYVDLVHAAVIGTEVE